MDSLNLRGSSQVNQETQLQVQKGVPNKDAQLRKAISDLNKQLTPLNLSVRFGYNEEVNFLYVQLVDTKTNRIIKQEPSTHFLKLKETIQSIIQDNIRVSDAVSNKALNVEDLPQQQVVVDELNKNLKPINEGIAFKYIDNQWVIVEKNTGKTIVVLDENQIDGLSSKIKEFTNLIGLIFDKKI